MDFHGFPNILESLDDKYFTNNKRELKMQLASGILMRRAL